jgi:GDPmannose 4,6-dehydratase
VVASVSREAQMLREDTTPPSLYPVPGQVVVRIDPRYYRPTEVETLLGDPTKAREKLGWSPRTTFEEMVAEMVRCDLEEARRDELCHRKGFKVFNYHE